MRARGRGNCLFAVEPCDAALGTSSIVVVVALSVRRVRYGHCSRATVEYGRTGGRITDRLRALTFQVLLSTEYLGVRGIRDTLSSAQNLVYCMLHHREVAKRLCLPTYWKVGTHAAASVTG